MRTLFYCILTLSFASSANLLAEDIPSEEAQAPQAATIEHESTEAHPHAAHAHGETKSKASPKPKPQSYDGLNLTAIEQLDMGADPRKEDTDGDGLTDDAELFWKTDMLQADTDHDGISDGPEVLRYKTNPKDPRDSPCTEENAKQRGVTPLQLRKP